ncbi:hypothetical protein CS542_00800 [Pedobacter sp. IW39]|nr:hypothetical protein CS542_00800 [Pedobacter sp. IW39]
MPGMKAGYGRIINIVSTSVKHHFESWRIQYNGLPSWIALSSGEYNITVNNVLPGLTYTTRYKLLDSLF